jgi:hypothetical protein
MFLCVHFVAANIVNSRLTAERKWKIDRVASWGSLVLSLEAQVDSGRRRDLPMDSFRVRAVCAVCEQTFKFMAQDFRL